MLGHLRANLWLLALTVFLCCVAYPSVLLVVGQTAFPAQANGSLLFGESGQPVGSRLIAQPFTSDEYFQPRPSAVSYNAAASGASNWGASNPLLRDRVARQLGPIVKYASGPKKGLPVASDIERWFQANRFQSQPGIVAHWAETHPALAQNWVKADRMNADFVAEWQKDHAEDVSRWAKENLENRDLKPEDLAVPFFKSFANEHPGAFPAAVVRKSAGGKIEKRIEPVNAGIEVQSIFFDMWLQDNPTVALEPVPADMVTTSGSGLDPHITLKNALYQLDRVAAKWAAETQRDAAQVRNEIEAMLYEQAHAPLGGLAGVDLVNALELNLALETHYGPARNERGRRITTKRTGIERETGK